MKQNLVGKILGKIKIFGQDFVTIVTGIRPFLELPDFQTLFCPFSVLRIFRFLALPEIAHFRFEIFGNRFSARARAENVGDFRHGPLPKIWCRKCFNVKHATSHAHHKKTMRCWFER